MFTLVKDTHFTRYRRLLSRGEADDAYQPTMAEDRRSLCFPSIWLPKPDAFFRHLARSVMLKELDD